MINLLTQNGKMKKTSLKAGKKVMNFNISACKNKKTGKITCPFAGECKNYCFAQKGNYKRYPKIEQLLDDKHILTLSSNFPELMDKIIKSKRKLDFIRIHDSGDFYSIKYVNKWLDVIRNNPQIKFYAYSKSHTLFENIKLPSNFDLIKSLGGTQDHKIDQAIDRHAKIFASVKAIKKAGYKDASSFDLFATKWYNKSNNKIGLLLH